jgi:UDP-N-acetylmuramoylalanine--D-glutamate ligase
MTQDRTIGFQPAARLLAGQQVAVVGMGKSGAAAVQLLLEHGAQVHAIDQKQTGQVHGIPILPQTAASLQGAGLVVLSPGVPADLDILQGHKVIGEVELAGWFLQGDTIGITGSNGKTTTTALTGHILKNSGIPCQVGGNIGTPPTAMIDSSRPSQWNVLELSSFQLETIETFHARVAVAMNVTDNHLDRHYTFANYAKAKGKLFETQQPGDTAILNADNVTTVGYARLSRAERLWFSSKKSVPLGAWVDGPTIRLNGEPLIEIRHIPLRGSHNWENVMAAALASHVAGATLEQIGQAVRTFPGVEHRLELVRTVNGVAYYNDSKATSVDATLKAIDAFPGGIWIILGGKDKNSDYTVLRDPLRAKAHAALLIGAAGPKIAPKLDGAVPLIDSQTLDAAVERAAREAKPGDIVLLAPACASFDQFSSFEHRGQVFKKLVSELQERSES